MRFLRHNVGMCKIDCYTIAITLQIKNVLLECPRDEIFTVAEIINTIFQQGNGQNIYRLSG